MTSAPVDDAEFYGKAKRHWAGIPANVNGMLGGYGHISSTDINGSLSFVGEYLEPSGKTKRGRALDCGAGIGRITKHLLTRIFTSVDMLELNQAFLDQAKDSYLGAAAAAKVENYFCCGMQDFKPEAGRYDVIWCQWVLGQLRDEHLVTFFARCKPALAENGIIVLKENINDRDSSQPDFDAEDSSYCRTRDHLVSLVDKAGLTIVKEEKETRFPKQLYEVRSFVCR